MRKMRFFTLLSISTQTFANLNKIQQDFTSLIRNKTLSRNFSPNNGFRTFASEWAEDFIASINQYGCWCYFDDDHGKGRGKPANPVDELCKILQQGYSCVIMDSEAEGSFDCIPWEVNYNSATALGISGNPSSDHEDVHHALRDACANANPFDKCARRSCIVENFFVMENFKLFLTGYAFDPSLLHSLGKFDRVENCPKKIGPSAGIESGKGCCGEFPVRFPYKLKNKDGARGCCGQKTYSIEFMQCCPGDQVKMSCNLIG